MKLSIHRSYDPAKESVPYGSPGRTNRPDQNLHSRQALPAHVGVGESRSQKMKGTPVSSKRRIFSLLAALMLALGGSVLIAAPSSAAVRGLDLQRSGCDAQAPGTYIVLRAWNVDSWRCHGNFDLRINFDAACRWTYGGNSKAYYLDRNNPYTWRCT
jgi:hypothetical protein